MTADQEHIWERVERRLQAVEPFVAPKPRWQSPDDPLPADGRFTVTSGQTTRIRGPRRWSEVVLAAVVLLLVGTAVLLGRLPSGGDVGGNPSAATPAASVSRPEVVAAFDPRVTITHLPSGWVVARDDREALGLVYVFDDVEHGGNNVGATVLPLTEVYDPTDESKRLPAPDDFVAWLSSHPDLETQAPRAVTVGGVSAEERDATVTYQAGGQRGMTAAFVAVGAESLNVEPDRRMRFVILDLPGGRVLLILTARSDLFDAAITPFGQLRDAVRIDLSAAPP